MSDENPSLIQDPKGQTARSNLPLLLIHDGGGTCFAYWCLNELDRRLYGIHNPIFHSREPREGGIPEVARQYVQMARKVIPKGRFILGGWSFGGMVALEMARLLTEDASLQVAGLIMIDTPCPLRCVDANRLPHVLHKFLFSDRTKQETREKVMCCFAEAGKMVSAWNLPIWEETSTAEGEQGFSHTSIAMDSFDEKSVAIRQLEPPPAILMRAEDPVPGESRPDGAVVFVDRWRQDPLLGWAQYRPDLFKRVIDIPGHHYNVFAEEHIKTITTKLEEACRTIEDIIWRSG